MLWAIHPQPSAEAHAGVAPARDGQSAQADFVWSLRRIEFIRSVPSWARDPRSSPPGADVLLPTFHPAPFSYPSTALPHPSAATVLSNPSTRSSASALGVPRRSASSASAAASESASKP